MSKKYNRSFLIFNEEDKGFEVSSDKKPTGYTKIETKNGRCKITVYAQNLKTEKGPYCCYLVDSSKKSAVVAKLGEFCVDDTGRGETIWEDDEKNIFGTGLSADRFNVAAVVKEGSRLQVPLAGHVGKEKSMWRDKITDDSFKPKGLNEDDHGLKENVGDIISSSNPNIRDQISEIVERAEIEVLEENKEIVEETRALIKQQEDVSSDDLIQVISGNNDNTNQTSDHIHYSEYDEQLVRDDNDYVDQYSDDGMKFLNYEQDINLLSDDISYADNMAKRNVNFPKVNKMHVLKNGNYSLRDYKDEFEDEFEELNDDARDIVSREEISQGGILSRTLTRMNVSREDMCDAINVDFDELDKEVEKEFKKFLDRELTKYKQSILKHVCKSDHHEEHEHHSHHHNAGEVNDHMCDDSHDCGHHNHDSHNKGKDYGKIIEKILDDCEEVKVKGAKGCRFWKISADSKFPNKENSLYPYYSAIHHLKMTYPYINYVKYFKTKGHYYFGIKYDQKGDMKYLIYGIVGDKKESHQPYKGMTGFVSWTPHEESGMWLMYYNPFTGCVMLPKGKGKKK
ncbi:MAG: hypothetical protein RR645_05890 [Clostridium sp.]